MCIDKMVSVILTIRQGRAAKKEFVYIVKQDRGNQEKAGQVWSEFLDKKKGGGDCLNP